MSRITSKRWDDSVRKTSLNDRINFKGNAYPLRYLSGHAKGDKKNAGLSYADAMLLEDEWNLRSIKGKGLDDRYDGFTSRKKAKALNDSIAGNPKRYGR